ncbi:hypothetical protein V6N11_016611 [Hibiscus sabdariffa]|uniref:RNase H type-1 domain-containing protein n=1 Tax=Hibiscus sabdariffa TaxID=183260 RepID=A0ABR2TWF2_9ROSI
MYDLAVLRIGYWCKCNWLESILSVLDFTREPQACSVQDKISKRSVGVYWELPVEGAVKFNVDAAVNGVVGPTGIGGVLKDHTGKILLCFSKYIGFSDPTSAELQGILEACCCFVGSQWVGTESLIIESDSEIAVNWIKRHFSVPASFKELVGKCKEYIDRYKLDIVFMFRERNSEVHRLAKEGLQNPFEYC